MLCQVVTNCIARNTLVGSLCHLCTNYPHGPLTDILTAEQDILRFLWNSRLYCRVHNSEPLFYPERLEYNVQSHMLYI
jgi:hypothetical protein